MIRPIATAIAATLGGALALSTPHSAASTQRAYDLPNPPSAAELDEREVVLLPMPGDLRMAFRRIEVPGGDFWFDEARRITLGDNAANVFSKAQRVEINAPFSRPGAQTRWYYIGVYEVTKAQYAAVLGNGDIDAGLAILARRTGDPLDEGLAALTGEERLFQLARPVTGLPTQYLDEFIALYNAWLFSDLENTLQLPAYAYKGTVRGEQVTREARGYVRLPTQIEWEYAVRGGMEARDAGTFDDRLPFAPARLAAHAWTSENAPGRGTAAIGRKEPAHGLYDTIGNASELMLDPFLSQLGSGTVGARVKRGGDANSNATQISSGRREEIALFERRRGSETEYRTIRSPLLGMRLMIGAPIRPDRAREDALNETYRSAAVAQSEEEQNGAISATNANPNAPDLVRTNRLSREISNRIAAAPEEAINTELKGALNRDIQDVTVMLDRAMRRVVVDLIGVAVRDAASVADRQSTIRRQKDAIARAEALAKRNASIAESLPTFRQRLTDERRGQDRDAAQYYNTLIRLTEYGPSLFRTGHASLTREARGMPELERAALALVADHFTRMMTRQATLEDLRRTLIQTLVR